MARKYEYKITENPRAPSGAKTPVMYSQEFEDWFNNMDGQGWEFHSYMQRLWNDDTNTQQFWVFRRPYQKL